MITDFPRRREWINDQSAEKFGSHEILMTGLRLKMSGNDSKNLSRLLI
jgi:hypothetical protein